MDLITLEDVVLEEEKPVSVNCHLSSVICRLATGDWKLFFNLLSTSSAPETAKR